MTTLDKLGTGSSITIEELTPAGDGWSLRKVVLVGAALPFFGAEWGFENNLKTTWYPGNPEGSQQNLGPREMPSSWEGEWNRTRMVSAPSAYIDEQGQQWQVVSPMVLRDALEAMGRDGQRLRVTWAVRGTFAGPRKTGSNGLEYDGDEHVLDVKLVREGRMKTLRTPIDRATDMRWTMAFEWVSRGPAGARIANARPDDADATTAADALTASLNLLQEQIDARLKTVDPTALKSASVFTLGQLESLAGTPSKLVTGLSRSVQQQVSRLKQVGDIAVKLRAQPFAIAGSVLDLAANTVAIANSFTHTMSRQPAEQRALKPKVATLLRSYNYFNHTELAAADCAQKAEALDAQFRRSVVNGFGQGQLTGRDARQLRAGDILAVHICKAGDTPDTVSQKYYGDNHHAVDVLRGNRLPWHTPTFRQGQILVIFALGTTLAKTRA